MEEFDFLYDSYLVKGSYFNKMIHCGTNYNRWLEIALCYLPRRILFKFKNRLAFFSTPDRDACRLPRELCKKREIILLSERILPKEGAVEDQSEVRYFIFSVLHEIAHVFKKHRFENLTYQENQAQENEADKLAISWFNDHIKLINNPCLKIITFEEINTVKEKNQKLMEKLYKRSDYIY